MPISPKIRLAIWERDAGICQLCQQPVPFDRYMHADHVKAEAFGGSTTVENLRTTHRLCNQRRGTGQPRSQQGHVALQVRLPDDLHAEIKQLTEQDDRPLNRTVVRLLRSGLAAESEYKALRQAVSLLNSMIECGEKHSAQSRGIVEAVLAR